jgi:hypothetical protein
MRFAGQMMFVPQAARYTNGAPDIGYYYVALDYTMADLILTGERVGPIILAQTKMGRPLA